jgi:hypothetical protein
MRIMLKIFACIAIVIVAPLYGICKVALMVSGWILGILTFLVAVLAIAIMILVDPLGGAAWLVVAFLISPLGLPLLAAIIVEVLSGCSHALREFITS